MIGSWHTNLHEYAGRRLRLSWVPRLAADIVRRSVERHTLQVCLLFYRVPRVVLAPNRELSTMLRNGTGRPVFLMTRGVDADFFTPTRRTRTDMVVNIGYVGRLSPEKSVRV